MTDREGWLVIGIAGVTCGGKTTLANQLSAALAPVVVFHQDKYFYPDSSPRHVRCEGLEHNNYDVLTSLDMPAMLDDVTRTLRGGGGGGGGAARGAGGREVLEVLEVPGKSILIMEGFTVLNYKPLFDLCDLRYYFVLEYGECASRRALRLYEPPDVPGYFERCVWPEHLKYRAQIEKEPGVTLIDGARGDALQRVLGDLRRLGAVGARAQ